MSSPTALKINVVPFFETARRNHPTTRRSNPEDPVPQQSGSRNLKSVLSHY